MADPTKPDPVEIQKANEVAEHGVQQYANWKEKIESVETAFKQFNKAINEVGFKTAIDGLDKVQKATIEVRESFGDLTAFTNTTRDSITLLSETVGSFERTLKDYTITQEKLNLSIQEQGEKVTEVRKVSEEAEKKQTEASEKLAQKKEKEIELTKDLKKALDDLKEARSDVEKYEFEKIKTAKEKELKETKQAIKQLSKEEPKLIEEATKQKNSLVQAEKELYELTKQQINLQREAQVAAANLPLANFELARKKAIVETGDAVSKLTDKFLGLNSSTNIFGNALLAMSKDGKFGSSISDLTLSISKNLAESFLNPEKAANRFFNLLNERVVKSTLEFDKLGASVNKATGGFRGGFESVALGVGYTPAIGDLARFGVTMDRFAQVYGTLASQVGNFNNMIDSQRKLLVDNAAAMQNLGVSTETYSKLASIYLGSIGKSAFGANQAINQLARDALAVGKSVSDYTRDFENAMSKISGYGREATTIFKELNALSMATKGVVTAQDLLAISDKFKDFDSAADAVSKLNAMLGGTSVNMLDMMRADPAEQIMMIKRAAGEASLDFDKLNIGYKRLLAEYFGGDINKAAAFFKMNVEDAEQSLRKQAVDQEALAKAQERSAAFQEKLTALVDNLKIVLIPVIEGMNSLLSVASKVMGISGAPLVTLLGLIGGSIGVLIWSFRRVQAIAVKALASIGLDTEKANLNMQAYTASIRQATTAMLELKAASSGAGVPGTPTVPGTTPSPATPPVLGPAAPTAGRFGGLLGRLGNLAMIGMITYSLASILGDKASEKIGAGKYYKDQNVGEAATSDQVAEEPSIPEGDDIIAKPKKGTVYHVTPDGRVSKQLITAPNDQMTVLAKDGGILDKITRSEKDFNETKTAYKEYEQNKIIDSTVAAVTAAQQNVYNTNIANTMANMAPQQLSLTMNLPEAALKQIARYSVDLTADGLGTKQIS